jgi:diguanylate cyclase (GGDEF)-like protein/excisionase family DNA binding protein
MENPLQEQDDVSANTDIRAEVVQVLLERSSAIVNDSVAIFPFNGPTPLETEYCERLGRLLLQLLALSVERRLTSRLEGIGELQRLASERNLSPDVLFSFAYLTERTVMDELALHPMLGATSAPWPLVAQTVRRASFDLLAAYAERVQIDTPVPTSTDRLTTLFSRAMMDLVLSTEVQRDERFSFPIALIVFDVDRLSEINTNHGYGVGDRLLERLGILIRKYFRQNDWVFRHGEDSIAVLLCQAPAEEVLLLASRVVAMVEQRLGFKDHRTDGRVHVTVSAAVVTGQGSFGEPFDAERMLIEADVTMRRAKSLGRNRVESTALLPAALSVQGAARYLQCSAAVVQRLIADGTLKTTGSGQDLRIHKLEVDDYRRAKVLDIRPRSNVRS